MSKHVAANALLPAVLFVISGIWTADPSSSAIVAPPDHAILSSGNCYVICKGDAGGLTIDGAPRAREPFAAPLHAARFRLRPGKHEVGIGDRKLAVWVASEGKEAPAGWKAYRLHPIGAGTDACARCHETARRDGRTEVGAVRGLSSCLECHKPAEFETKHSHPLDPLRHCGSCHAPHGSPYKGLLKAPVKKLCAECHD
jgi:predicted CXXCH cytochrome family protein